MCRAPCSRWRRCSWPSTSSWTYPADRPSRPDELLSLFAFSPARYAEVVPRWLPGLVGSATLDLRQLRVLPRQLHSSLFQSDLADGVRPADRAPVWSAAISGVLRGDRGGRRRRASRHASRRIGADDRRLGGDLRHHGRGDAFRVPARRAARPAGPRRRRNSYHVPAAPLSAMLRDPRILAFLAVWFGVNFIFGMGAVSMPGTEGTVAWQAHIGGFLAGLLGLRFVRSGAPLASRRDGSSPITADDDPSQPTVDRRQRSRTFTTAFALI